MNIFTKTHMLTLVIPTALSPFSGKVTVLFLMSGREMGVEVGNYHFIITCGTVTSDST